MENAKHIGCMCALAVALGVGMALANTPAVASAAPADSGTGSSGHSDSTSSDTPSAKSASSATNDAPGRHRRPLNPSGESAPSSSGGTQISTTTGSSSTASTGRPGKDAILETPGTGARQHGGAVSRLESGFAPAKTGPKPAVVNAAVTPPAAAAPVAALTTAITPPVASTITKPTSADPVSLLVSTVINAVLSPFANSAPTAPAQPAAALTMLAFARREFEQSFSNPSITVTPPVAQTTSSAVDPDFISSPHNFGLFSATSAADPNDNNFVALVFSTPIFTDVLTSGTDPEDNLGLGAASTGVAGQTVNTFMSPFFNFTIGVPITDPFAELFTALVRAGF
jgi:hypothetical protein